MMAYLPAEGLCPLGRRRAISAAAATKDAADAEGAAAAAAEVGGERVGADEAAREALGARELEVARLLRLAVDEERGVRLGEEARDLMGHADVVPAARLEGETKLE